MIVLTKKEADKFGLVKIEKDSYYQPIELKNGDFILPDGAESLVTDRALVYEKRAIDLSEHKTE